jgi:hypothetical protein
MDRLWTPWRSAYMKQNRENSRCIFCDAASQKMQRLFSLFSFM